MLGIFFADASSNTNISLRYQRSEGNYRSKKKKTRARQDSWDGKVTGDFIPRHLSMHLIKQNHAVVSIASARSNKSNKNC